MNWDLPRPPTSLSVMTGFGVERGMTPEQCLAGTGLRIEQLADPTVEATGRHDLTVSRNLLHHLGAGDPNLGLGVGLRYHLTAYGIWGFALISSPTLGDAVETGVRFFDLTFSLGRVRLRHEEPTAMLVLDAPDVPAGMQRFFVERDAAAIMTIGRELFGDPLVLNRIDFAFPAPPAGAGRCLEIFGVSPSFDAAETLMMVDAEGYCMPLPQANPHTTALAVAQCRQLLDKRLARTGVAGRVRDELVARIADAPDAEQVAGLLHLSPRTLRRRLSEEGTSFRAIVEEVREHLAEELLITAGLSVEQTAYRLGYLEVSSFSQAFRRWKGMGPREFRFNHPAYRRGTS